MDCITNKPFSVLESTYNIKITQIAYVHRSTRVVTSMTDGVAQGGATNIRQWFRKSVLQKLSNHKGSLVYHIHYSSKICHNIN